MIKRKHTRIRTKNVPDWNYYISARNMFATDNCGNLIPISEFKVGSDGVERRQTFLDTTKIVKKYYDAVSDESNSVHFIDFSRSEGIDIHRRSKLPNEHQIKVVSPLQSMTNREPWLPTFKDNNFDKQDAEQMYRLCKPEGDEQ